MIITLPKLNYQTVEKKIIKWIQYRVSKAKAKGVVFGLSGGIDSAVTTVLVSKAISNKNSLALMMPTYFTPKQDTDDAMELLKKHALPYQIINIDKIFNIFLASINTQDNNHLVKGNLYARIRMTINYYFSNTMNYLVAGTGDKSEYLIGFFTKFGDGAADIYPILHLYKTQIRELGHYLGLKDELCYKSSSPQLWPGHQATDELPIDYPILDRILYALFNLKMRKDKVAKELRINLEKVNEVIKRYEFSEHKRTITNMIQD